MSQVDVYDEAQREAQAFVDKTNAQFTKFQNLVRKTDTTQKAFKDFRKALVKDIRKLTTDLKELRETGIEYVEKNKSKFPLIKESELKARKKAVGDMESTLENIKMGIDSEEVRRKIEADTNKTSFNAQDEASAALNNAARNDENSRFIKGQKQEVLENIKQQDVALTGLGEAVDRLNVMGKTINEELKDQDKMLDALSTEIAVEEGKMTAVLHQIQKLLKTKVLKSRPYTHKQHTHTYKTCIYVRMHAHAPRKRANKSNNNTHTHSSTLENLHRIIVK